MLLGYSDAHGIEITSLHSLSPSAKLRASGKIHCIGAIDAPMRQISHHDERRLTNEMPDNRTASPPHAIVDIADAKMAPAK